MSKNLCYIFSVNSSTKLCEDTASNVNLTISETSTSDRIDNIIPTIVEPVNYENYIHQHHASVSNNSIENDDPLMDFPEGSDDVDVYVLPRKVRTLLPAGPEEDM